MKKLIILSLSIFLTTALVAQPTFDLGLKAGINNSKLSLNIDDYNSESILKAHIGAFSRLGWGRIFIQPEAYFSSKGGNISTNVFTMMTSFDYGSLDIPVLLGVKLIKGESIGLHAVAGPVFNIVTTTDVDGETLLTKEFYKDNYYSFQYGLGLDVYFITIDARMEHGQNSIYSYPTFNMKNNTFMISLGFKFF